MMKVSTTMNQQPKTHEGNSKSHKGKKTPEGNSKSHKGKKTPEGNSKSHKGTKTHEGNSNFYLFILKTHMFNALHLFALTAYSYKSSE
jgi:hypothetical protein